MFLNHKLLDFTLFCCRRLLYYYSRGGYILSEEKISADLPSPFSRPWYDRK